jgi:AhpD family alkylhydroperoxidase
LGRAGRRPAALLGRRIGAELREQRIVHVSALNDCLVCTAVHSAVGRAAGVPAQTLQAARHAQPIGDERTQAALRYAELRTREVEHEHPEQLRQFEALFATDEQREIRAIVDLFTFTTRFHNTWESHLPGSERRRRRLGLCAQCHQEQSDSDQQP